MEGVDCFGCCLVQGPQVSVEKEYRRYVGVEYFDFGFVACSFVFPEYVEFVHGAYAQGFSSFDVRFCVDH